MYSLILFYHTLQHELAGLKPFPKLLCIKAVVFFTFWYVCVHQQKPTTATNVSTDE